MMKITCGTDVIEINRIKESIDTMEDRFLDRVYTKKEQKYCESKNAQKFQHYAARFAAKEAVFKAISSELNSKYDVSWQDIEIVNDEQGRPSVKVKGIQNADIDISLSHCKEYATANCVVVWNEII